MSSEAVPVTDRPLLVSNDHPPQTEDGLDQGSYTAHRLVGSFMSCIRAFTDFDPSNMPLHSISTSQAVVAS